MGWLENQMAVSVERLSHPVDVHGNVGVHSWQVLPVITWDSWHHDSDESKDVDRCEVEDEVEEVTLRTRSPS